jgi:hypothetical protein
VNRLIVGILATKSLASIPALRAIIPKLTKQLAEKGNINTVLIEVDETVKEKLNDLERIISFLSEVESEVEFAILKMQPIITHLGNDIDVLIRPKDVKHFLQRFEKMFRIHHIELHENIRRGFKATIHLSDMKLNQVELYTYLGWYGYFFISSDELLKSRQTAVFAFDNASFSVPVLSNTHAFIVDILHAVFGNRFISLGDLVKLLSYLYLETSFADNAEGNSFLNRREIVMAINCFVKSLRICLTDVLSSGRCYIPLRYLLHYSIISSLENFFINKELSLDVYWKELRRILNTEWRRLAKSV